MRKHGPGTLSAVGVGRAAAAPPPKAAAQPLHGGKDGDLSPAASWPAEVLPKGL